MYRPDHGYHRHRRVAQPVAPHHAPPRNALGARGADVVLAQHRQHRAAGHPGDVGGHHQAQRRRRQHQLVEPVERVVEPGVADHREQSPVQREHQQDEDAGDEYRKRQPDQRQQARGVVDRPVAVQRRPDPDGHADHAADDQRRQRQVDGVRQHRADVGQDRPAGHHRAAEVARQRSREEVHVLPPDRHVEAEFGVQRGDALRRRAVAQDGDRRIARHDADDQEHQRKDGKQRRDRRDQTADDVPRHGRPCAGHPCRSGMALAKTWMAGTIPAVTAGWAWQANLT